MNRFLSGLILAFGFVVGASFAGLEPVPKSIDLRGLSCTPVGNGGAYSCTNGTCWICYGDCGGASSLPSGSGCDDMPDFIIVF